MSELKNFIVSLALAVVISISILLLIPLSFVLKDKATGGVINASFEEHLYNVTRAQNELSPEYLQGKMSSFLSQNDFAGLADWAENYDVEYYITTFRGRPVMTSKNWHATPSSIIVYSFEAKEKEEVYEVRTYQKIVEVDDTSTVIPELWHTLYNHAFQVLMGCISLLCILILCLWQFILHARPLFKINFFMLYVMAFDIVYYLLVNNIHPGKMIIYLIAEKVLLTGLAGAYLHYLKKLRKGIQAINQSEQAATNPASYPISLRPFAKDVAEASNHISVAVNERMKSERLKTELISNVSHDLKTPLTSIINFSDLILNEQTSNTNINEYASHLHSQSIRLKNLLDSLIEASKASCGAIEINMIPCNVQTMLEQCIVEYETKLQDNQIELVDLPFEEKLMIMADTNALCRIFDNLLVNIAKYALPGSRAYLEVTREGKNIVISFKNVSKEACNLSADELTERFVQGDASRHTEGHGLGLSIVKSLMDLMNADLEISSRYDMFEVRLIFPTIIEDSTSS